MIPGTMIGWPASEPELVRLQEELGRSLPDPWHPPPTMGVGGCFACTGAARERLETGWAAAVVLVGDRCAAEAVVSLPVTAPYRPGLLALRSGALLDAAVRALDERPSVLLVDATGRDHPRRAGLALHLGAALDLPTVGVTHRPLLAQGDWPADERGARSPLTLDAEIVGVWLRTRKGARPLAVHAAWRTDAETAAEIVLSHARMRTPDPLRRARALARAARAAAG